MTNIPDRSLHSPAITLAGFQQTEAHAEHFVHKIPSYERFQNTQNGHNQEDSAEDRCDILNIFGPLKKKPTDQIRQQVLPSELEWSQRRHVFLDKQCDHDRQKKQTYEKGLLASAQIV
jgi:hypothetical protein